MSADPFKTLRDRQLQYQAEPVVLVDPATGEAGAQVQLSGSRSWQSSGYLVSGGATQLAPTPLAGRRALAVACVGPGNIFVGATDAVGVEDGDLITPGQTKTYPFDASVALYAVSDQDNTDVRVVEVA